MALFEYIAIALSLVFSFTVLRIVGGLPYAIRPGRTYWVHLVFVITTLLYVINAFWALWSYRNVDWTYLRYLLALAYPSEMHWSDGESWGLRWLFGYTRGALPNKALQLPWHGSSSTESTKEASRGWFFARPRDPLPNKRLQLTSHGAFQSVRGTVWRRALCLQRWQSALLAAAERPVRYTAVDPVNLGALGSIGDFVGGLGVVRGGRWKPLQPTWPSAFQSGSGRVCP